MQREPEITINGVRLTEAQAATVRVACSQMASFMAEDDALGADQHGRRMVEAYQTHLHDIFQLMETAQ